MDLATFQAALLQLVIIILANLKGGVGKTTGVIQLADELAKLGYYVLIVDGDPGISSTEALGFDAPPFEDTKQVGTLFEVLTNPNVDFATCVTHYTGTAENPIAYAGKIDIIRGSRRILKAPEVFDDTIKKQPVESFEKMPSHIFSKHCQGTYHYVLIDPSPSIHRLTDTLLYAANGALAPVSPEAMSVNGAMNFMGTLKQSNLDRAMYRIEGETRFLGFLLSKVIADQQGDAQELATKLDSVRIPRSNMIIPYTRATYKSVEANLPVSAYAPGDPAALAYQGLAKEVEEKIRGW